MTFIHQLTFKQLQHFFKGIGQIYDVKRSHHEDMLDVFFMDNRGKTFWYSIADNYICAPGFHKTSEDWKFYMKELFGEKYFQKYAEMPVTNAFVEELTLEDMKELLEQKTIKIETIKEEEAFREGTRRFKIRYSTPAYYKEHEIIIGPHFDYCSELPGVNETIFMKLFTKKFGMDFVRYYMDIEKKKCNEKVEEYRMKCERKLSEKRKIMVSTWENM